MSQGGLNQGPTRPKRFEEVQGIDNQGETIKKPDFDKIKVTGSLGEEFIMINVKHYGGQQWQVHVRKNDSIVGASTQYAVFKKRSELEAFMLSGGQASFGEYKKLDVSDFGLSSKEITKYLDSITPKINL